VTTFGDLQIAASAKINGAGPFQTEPVVFHWPWYWHLPRLGPWLLLGLAVALPARNRDRRAILIFIPLVILSVLWPLVMRHTTLPSASLNQFALLFESLIVGLALLWLNADTLRRRHGLVRVPMSLGILVLAGLVAALSSGLPLSDPFFVIFLIFVAVMGAVLLLALALTRRTTHRRYVPRPFLLWLVAWTLLFMTAGTVLLLTAMPLLITRGAGVLWPALWLLLKRATLTGLVLGVCLYAVNLPYLLLMFSSPFFRRRFLVWLGAESALPQDEAVHREGSCSGE
jgi:hypothetical protein